MPRKTTRLSIRVSLDEKKTIEHAARLAKRSTSHFLRHLALKDKSRDRTDRQVRQQYQLLLNTHQQINRIIAESSLQKGLLTTMLDLRGEIEAYLLP